MIIVYKFWISKEETVKKIKKLLKENRLKSVYTSLQNLKKRNMTNSQAIIIDKLISKNIYKIRKIGELKKNRDLKNTETGGYLNMPNNKRNFNLVHFTLTLPDFNILDNDKNKKNNGNN